MNESSPAESVTSHRHVYIGQPQITDEIGHLFSRFMDKHPINVRVISANDIIEGRLEKNPHKDRINILQKNGQVKEATVAFIDELTHDIVHERTPSLTREAALA